MPAGTWRHGPVLGGTTERLESLNKPLRRNLDLTNRHAPGLDLMNKFSVFLSEQHIVLEGWWCVDNEYMTRAGDELLNLCQEKWMRSMIGLPNPKISGPKTQRLRHQLPATTQAPHNRLVSTYDLSWSRTVYRQFSRCLGSISCGAGSFVQCWESSTIFRVNAPLQQVKTPQTAIALVEEFRAVAPQNANEDICASVKVPLLASTRGYKIVSIEDLGPHS
ncbi:hypothetical protein K470DRAFT_266876 [Piedraia hortae CBS 480.64]|uniref:Uncharacterized protein n=1 Tax=Piedraia hortae CBS 480.64 TaxID=1314780 RepID=A0A6A7BRS9_9PEZI|nr:hypothetical protein K470DRAFT_266876 [Piedraia hortae CBS 480.64]